MIHRGADPLTPPPTPRQAVLGHYYRQIQRLEANSWRNPLYSGWAKRLQRALTAEIKDPPPVL